MSNVWATLKAPVACTLPLGEFLRVKPEIWDQIAKHLNDQGLLRHETGYEDQISESPSETSKHLPLNKVNGSTKKDEGNTTLPLEYEGVMSIAILDSGAGISIATRSIWEKWGKPKVKSTRMNLQLADGKLENLIGLLEGIKVYPMGLSMSIHLR